MTDKVNKFINSLDKKTKNRLKQRLIELKTSPFNMPGVKKLSGWGNNAFRFRLGKIRVIYGLFEGEVEIIDIDYRGNIY